MASTPRDIKSDGKSKNRDYNIYTEEFYGGSDCFIYINGVRNYNVAAVQFSVQEQHKPIYGYSSRTFDDVAVGNRIVVGAIKFPVRNEGKADRLNDFNSRNVEDTRNYRTVDVPDWVHNYEPDMKEEQTGIKYEKSISSNTLNRVAKVQSKLQDIGHNVYPTGIYDNKTKIAITKFKRENEMIINNKIDKELENALNINRALYMTIGRQSIYISPDENSKVIRELDNGDVMYIEGRYNEWALIKSESVLDGIIKGYIKFSNIVEVA